MVHDTHTRRRRTLASEVFRLAVGNVTAHPRMVTVYIYKTSLGRLPCGVVLLEYLKHVM